MARKSSAIYRTTYHSLSLLLKDKECTIKRNRCSKRHARKCTETTQQYFHDGTPANRTEPLIGWKEKGIMLYDRIALKKHFHVKHWILTLNAEGSLQPLNQRPDSCSSEKRMQTIARRAPGKDPARLQNHHSQSSSKTKKRTTVRRNRRIRLRG